jgi:hypothetical protein
MLNKTTDRHSEYVLLIAFPGQQWLRERATILRRTCIARPVEIVSFRDLEGLDLFRSRPL